MAIRASGPEKTIENAPGQSFDIFNGDWAALKKVTQKWGLKDEASALRFALAVLAIAEDGTLQVGDDIVSPMEGLRKDG